MPEGRPAVEKRPRSLGRSSTEAELSKAADVTMTVGPICGVPAPSIPTPLIFPDLGARGRAQLRTPRDKEKNSAKNAPRYFRTFTGYYLPCGCGVAAARTVKLVVWVMVFLERLSVTETSSLLFPGRQE